mmetsp:Transcript_57561/g.106343  ORF Transcript_57561/g.106343 Transcript_57561/m.106343 type:complete len:281 (-) Transcript_57561:238-1080(-)
MDSIFQQLSPSLTMEPQQSHWAAFNDEQSSAYIIRLVVSAAVLFILTSEQIHLDPPGVQYRKAVMCCLLAETGLLAASYVGYELRDPTLLHTSTILSEAFWVLVNCTVFHFPAKILAEPQWKTNCFCYCSFVMVLVATFVHHLTDFNFAYIANVIVSAYTLVLLVRLTSALRRYGKPLKPVESLMRMEYFILFLNMTIVLSTAYTKMGLYPIKAALRVMYWMRIHMVLVQYGREFIPERKGDGKEGSGVQLHDSHPAKPAWGSKAMAQLSSSIQTEILEA